jgi:hypothetical protein
MQTIQPELIPDTFLDVGILRSGERQISAAALWIYCGYVAP